MKSAKARIAAAIAAAAIALSAGGLAGVTWGAAPSGHGQHAVANTWGAKPAHHALANTWGAKPAKPANT
jgi:hypothetical protein